MITKKITYTDYDGNERTEDFFFNLSKAELFELKFSVSGGYDKQIQNIIDTQDTTRIVAMFKEIIFKAYGEKSLDGKRFIKNNDLSEGFMQTEAYSVLLMDLISNENAAAAFISGILPKDLQAEVNKQIPNN